LNKRQAYGSFFFLGKKMKIEHRSNHPKRITEYYGIYTLDKKSLVTKLHKNDLDQFLDVIKNNNIMSYELADKIACAARNWAIENGAFHYCHWFQPQTSITAEKHESFLWLNQLQEPIEQFGGSDLIKSEPDASSFPSGGKRSTFEARGYTTWDPSSPMFIWGRGKEKTLYIPSIFVSYHGDALDFKTPLLRSNQVLSRTATKTLHLLGQKNITQVSNMIGAEQEFFVIDKKNYSKRLDLQLTGRTLFGKKPPKGQELEDHYFGHIPSPIHAFLSELEAELYKLGVPLKTKHNEVAPGQFEVAPIFEASNIAADHNQLIMNVMKEIAQKHNLIVLLHEKPFDHMNGSGKHINWSLCDSSGKNLLDPGQTPEENLTFLTFLCAVLLAVQEHADVLRTSIASSGNDHRLGGHEAPPAILSIFLGEHLDKILNAIESGKIIKKNVEKLIMNLGLTHIHNFSKDNTDRNRTSPFAFTGNKFEFRAAGSNASISYPTTVLNSAVSHALSQINEDIESKSQSGQITQNDLIQIIKHLIQKTKNIRFEGNGYSQEWAKEAQSRGLSNFKNTPQALKVLSNVSKTQFLIESDIFNQSDIESRLSIQYERYIKECLIELKTAVEMVQTQVIPSSLSYYKFLLEIQQLSRQSSASYSCDDLIRTVGSLLAKTSECLYLLQSNITKLESEFEDPESYQNIADNLSSRDLPQLNEIRLYVDSLEAIVPKDRWAYPSYSEMLFEI